MKKTLLNHLQELRSRLLLCLFFFLGFSVVGYICRQPLFLLLTKPLNLPLYYSTPAGGFNFEIELSLLFGFVLSLPLTLWQILEYIKPAFPKQINHVYLYLLYSIFLVITGIMFAYFISLPASLFFLNKFTTTKINPLISTDSYLSFISRYLLGFAVLFQLPIALFIANKIQRLRVRGLMSFEKWVILISFVIAAIITPTPDFINQTIMAVPIILLYQISVIVVAVTNRNR